MKVITEKRRLRNTSSAISVKSDDRYNDVIMSTMASQITSLTTVCSTVYSGAERKPQSSPSLAFVRGIHRWPMNSPHKWPVTRKMLPFDDIMMFTVVFSSVRRPSNPRLCFQKSDDSLFGWKILSFGKSIVFFLHRVRQPDDASLGPFHLV